MKYNYKVYIVLAFLISYIGYSQTTQTFNSSGTFTVPNGVTELTIEAWGAGGKGGNASKSGGNSTASAGGGGGGAYTTTTITVNVGDQIIYTVGAGSTTTGPGGTSTATNSAGTITYVIASGGNSAANASGSGVTTAGATGGNTGTFTGGNGASGITSRSGGGGSSAGTSSNGTNATTSAGATAPTGGGNGGNGTTGSANGTIGAVPGGGGGGARASGGGNLSTIGGNGANGQIRFTYDDGCNTLTSATTAVSNVNTRFTDVNQVTAPSGFLFGVGTDNTRNLVSFRAAGAFDAAVERLADRIVLRRAGTTGQVGGVNKDLLFFEKTAAYAGNSSLTPKEFKNNFLPSMEQALLGIGVNRGADNIFNNSTGSNNNNIERLDYIFTDGIVVPNDPTTAGFPIFERGGNDNFKLAVISALDTNEDPSEYNTVISYTSADWTSAGFSVNSSVLSRNGGSFTETANLTAQDIDVIFVSFADMGLSAGDVIYGYSLSGGDVNANCVEFLNFTNSSIFPRTTDSSSGNGGLDLMSGGSFAKRSYIYSETGWIDDDPNDPTLTPGCEDNISVHGGVAPLNSDMTFGNLSVFGGSLDLGTNTLSICNDINVENNFAVNSGILEMIGTTGTQNIRGDSKLIVELLTLNNPDGAVVATDVDVTNVLTITDGNLASNGFISLPCFFTEPSTGNFANGRAGQIGPIGNSGSITGDVQVEQCYPGRRAFRIVSASTTTTTSIQDNWQENATAYNNVPVASTTQPDGIPYGFGTHITGLGYLPAHSSTDASTTDQTGGLDWQPSGTASMFEYNNNGQAWVAITETESGAPETAVLNAGKPYLMTIRGSREVNLTTNVSPTSNTKLRSKGAALKGDVTSNYTVASDDFVLIGNPFHAIVDMTAVVSGNTGFTGFIYAFDPTVGGGADVNPSSTSLGGRGGFVTISLSNPNLASGTQMRQYLQAYQGVFMQAAEDNPSITFQESDKAVDQTQIDVFSTPNDYITLSLYDQNAYANNGTADDGLVILFNQNANNNVDINDAPKFTNPDENLARLEGNSLLSYEARAMPQVNEVLTLFNNQYRASNYVFVVNVTGLLNNSVYLYDNYTNTETILNNDASTAINFSVDESNPASIATDRFEIRFETSTLGTSDFNLQGISVYPNPTTDILNISLGQNTGRFNSLELFDINGRLIAKQSLDNQLQNAQMDVNAFSSGVYILKVSSEREQFSTKVIVE